MKVNHRRQKRRARRIDMARGASWFGMNTTVCHRVRDQAACRDSQRELMATPRPVEPVIAFLGVRPVARGTRRAHIPAMTISQTATMRKAPAQRSPKLTYRGIDLPRLTIPPRLPLAEIKRAVAEAFAERAPVVADD